MLIRVAGLSYPDVLRDVWAELTYRYGVCHHWTSVYCLGQVTRTDHTSNTRIYFSRSCASYLFRNTAFISQHSGTSQHSHGNNERNC
jgi:hypothetical protein